MNVKQIVINSSLFAFFVMVFLYSSLYSMQQMQQRQGGHIIAISFPELWSQARIVRLLVYYQNERGPNFIVEVHVPESDLIAMCARSYDEYMRADKLQYQAFTAGFRWFLEKATTHDFCNVLLMKDVLLELAERNESLSLRTCNAYFLEECLCGYGHRKMEHLVACSILHNIISGRTTGGRSDVGAYVAKINDLYVLLTHEKVAALNAFDRVKLQEDIRACLTAYIAYVFESVGKSILDTLPVVHPRFHPGLTDMVGKTVGIAIDADITNILDYVKHCPDMYTIQGDSNALLLNQSALSLQENCQTVIPWISSLSSVDIYNGIDFLVNPYLGIAVGNDKQNATFFPSLCKLSMMAQKITKSCFEKSAVYEAIVAQLAATTHETYEDNCICIKRYFFDVLAKAYLAMSLYEGVLNTVADRQYHVRILELSKLKKAGHFPLLLAYCVYANYDNAILTAQDNDNVSKTAHIIKTYEKMQNFFNNINNILAEDKEFFRDIHQTRRFGYLTECNFSTALPYLLQLYDETKDLETRHINSYPSSATIKGYVQTQANVAFSQKRTKNFEDAIEEELWSNRQSRMDQRAAFFETKKPAAYRYALTQISQH